MFHLSPSSKVSIYWQLAIIVTNYKRYKGIECKNGKNLESIWACMIL